MTLRLRPTFGLVLLSACIALRQPLEANPVGHVLVLLPALAVAGGLLAASLFQSRVRLSEPVANALVLVAVFVILYWMLPRAIDASLTDPLHEIAKFISIPVLVGGTLALAWPAAHPFLRGFLKANAVSMCAVMAFLYTHAPVRICNSYLVADQEQLGFGFLFAAFGLSVLWAVPLFLPPPPERHCPKHGLKPNSIPQKVTA